MKGRTRLALLSVGALSLQPLLQGGLGSGPVLDAVRRAALPVAKVAAVEAASTPRLPVGELADKRTRNSKTERRPDGKLTTTVYSSAVNYRDAKGKLQPIDSRLVSTSERGYRWVNGPNGFRSFFKGQLDNDYVRLDTAGSSFLMSLEGGASSRPAKVQGSRITYSGVLPSTDLRYDIESGAVKETLVLNSASAPTVYRFRLTTPANASIIPSQRFTGAWEVMVPGQPAPVLVLAAPQVQDAADGNKQLAPEQTPVSLDAQKLTNGKFQLTLALDSNWLLSSSRRFPVLLDPSIQIQPDTLDLTFTSSLTPCPQGGFCTTNGSFGGDRLWIGTDAKTTYRAALKFDLTAVPSGATVTAAELDMVADNVISVPNSASSHQIDAQVITTGWNPTSTVSPASVGPPTSFVYAGLPAMKWDVTSLVTNWFSGGHPNNGILLQRNPEVLGVGGVEPWSGSYTVDPTKTPKLVISWTDASVLFQPDTLHSNGAELRWTRYGSVGGVSFQRYEVHRSPTPNFTPSASTLLMSTTDVGTTTFRDTTAAPGGTFHYKLLANSVPSQEVHVTLPADGQGVKILRSAGAQGKDTDIVSGGTCSQTDGANSLINVGVISPGQSDIPPIIPPTVGRGMLGFNLKDIPSSATISGATLRLFHPYAATAAGTIRAYRISRDWAEGTSGCDGASWVQAQPSIPWTNAGGDFDPTAMAAVSFVSGEAPTTHQYDLKTLAQQWVSGQAPNLGVLLMADDEVFGPVITYDSADSFDPAADYPTLTVNYSENVHAIAPTVAIGAPAPGAMVSGTTAVNVAATDDRRVDRVELFADGSSVGVALSPPFSFSWNTTGLSNGPHSLTAKATDDAGNATTSAALTVTVNNYPAPTTSITAPANNATGLNGSVTVTTSNGVASGLSVSQVELYVDGARYGAAATAAPFSFSWNTLDAVQPAYDGSHVLTTMVYDSSGQVVTSAPVTVTVANTAGTQYGANFSSTQVPSDMAFQPINQLPYGVNVTVTNTSGQTWNPSTTFLRYRWLTPDGTTLVTDSGNLAALSLASGQNATVTAQVTPPALGVGVNRALFQLSFDVIDTTNTASPVAFAAKGNQPLTSKVMVNKGPPGVLGLEHFQQYVSTPIGAGMQHLFNVANGNSLLTLTPLKEPGRGLSTVASLTYNSLEDHSDSPAGNNFSLSISSLSRLGQPLDIHPQNADIISGRSNKFIEFIDGDGTLQHFDGVTNPDGTTSWFEPPGTHLFLRSLTTDQSNPRFWALTRPDRVTFFFNHDGWPTFVSDKNGNTLSFTLTPVCCGNDPGGPKFHITQVTDAAGQGTNPAPNRSFNIVYFDKSTAKKPQIRGKIASITDHLGHEIDFTYYEDGNLLRLTERGGANADGSFLADRSWVFTYTTPNGAGPAIPDPTQRVNPDPKTPSQSTRLFSVADPLGHETQFSYLGPGNGQDRWKLATLADRAGNTASFTYDAVNNVTTVAAPTPSGQTARTTKYAFDAIGRPTQITDPLAQQTRLQWNADNAVTLITEPNGKTRQFAYNDNGYPTDVFDELSDHTVLTYENVAADASDIGAHWNPNGGANGTGRTIPHLSQLSTKQEPNAVAAATSDKWIFQYSPDGKGNLVQVTKPLLPNNPAINTYNADGTVATVKDFNGNLTTYASYDANGLPTKVIDATDNPTAPTHPTQIGYDDAGRIRFIQDPNHAQFSSGDASRFQTQLFYDSFGRPGRQSAPKSTSLNLPDLVWGDVSYNANNDVVKTIAPHYGAQDSGTGDTTTFAYDMMDRKVLETGPDTSADPAGERTAYQYDVAGRLTQVTMPLGVQNGTPNNTHTLNLAYDALDRVVSQTRNHLQADASVQTLTTLACYDPVGNVISVTAPKAGLSSVTCPADHTTPFTTVYGYDAANHMSSVSDPLGHTTTFKYDRNGNRTQIIDANLSVTTLTYDALNRLVQVDQPFGTRTVTSRNVYDADSNLTQEISQRAFDASPDKKTFASYVTTYHYDQLNRVVKVDLPVDIQFPTPYFIHRAYDANGNLTSTSLPDTHSDPTLVDPSQMTKLTYFDPGWIATTQDSGTPRIHFDYTAKGEQSRRTPEDQGGNLDLTKEVKWTFYADGQLQSRTDQKQQPITYKYDADNQLVSSHDASGLTTPSQTFVDTQNTWDDLGRLTRSDLKKQTDTNWTFSTFAYDQNGNVTDQVQNGQESSPGGALVKAGRSLHNDYDGANWITNQFDFGSGSPTAPGPDAQRTVNSFTPIGLQSRREIDKTNGAGGWTPKQITTWGYFANGKLNQLTTTDGTGTKTLESHTVDYVDASGVYVNGHRTKDSFTLNPLGGATSGACFPTACNATYSYDPRDRLVSDDNGRGLVTTYKLDGAGNIQTELQGPNVSNQTVTKQYAYQGARLQQLTSGGQTQKFFYDDVGRLACTTNGAGLQGDCAPGSSSTNLVATFSYDYLDRLATFQGFSSGSQTDRADYTYDALDRVATETELHPSFNGNARTTQFSYLGDSAQLTEEQQSNSSGTQAVKDYTYDPFGKRLSQTVTGSTLPGVPNGTFTYGYDVHGSVSQLIDSGGNAVATYGYRPYGQTDGALTGGDPDPVNPINPFRFSAKRQDSGSGTLDMGVRRFGTDISHFLTPDFFYGALTNVTLSTDPLTQNRYGLAGGNPLSFREWDGHMALADGGGYADPSPSPTPPSNPSSTPNPTPGPAPGEPPSVGELPAPWWAVSGAGGALHGIEAARSELEEDHLEKLARRGFHFATEVENRAFLLAPRSAPGESSGVSEGVQIHNQFEKALEEHHTSLNIREGAEDELRDAKAARGLAAKLKVGSGSLLVAGSVIEGVSEGLDDYDKHQDAARAEAVGVGAGVGSLAGGVAGGLILGGACGAISAGTLAAVCGFIGASVGSYAGGRLGALVGGAIYDHRDQIGGFLRGVGGAFSKQAGAYGGG